MSDPQHRRSQPSGWAPPGQAGPAVQPGAPPPGNPSPWAPHAPYPAGQHPPGPMPPGGYPQWQPPRSRSALSPALIVALCGVVAGAIFEISYYSTHEVNGVLTDCDYTNFGPVLFGPLAIGAGLWAVMTRRRRPPERHRSELVGGLLCAALGLIHVLSGLGLLGGFHLSLDPSNPC